MLVIDRDNWKLYELFSARPVNNGASWNAASGAVFDLKSNALRPDGWTSADAAGLPIFPGLVRYDEVFEQREIKHALRFTVQYIELSTWIERGELARARSVLARMASSRKQTREFVEEFAMRDGRKIYVLGEGRLINLAAAEGHPASVMDMSFANQALSSEYMVKNHKDLAKKVHSVPEDLDKHVAKLKLEAMGVKIDRLTAEQEEYLASWSEGT